MIYLFTFFLETGEYLIGVPWEEWVNVSRKMNKSFFCREIFETL